MHEIFARSLFIPTLGWNYLVGRVLKRRNWWDEVVPHVILGALPLRRDVPRLHDLGVRAVVNMCKEYPGPIEEYHKFGIEQLRLPTVDFNPPSLSSVEKGVEFIQNNVAQAQTVYIHCKAGRARSATIVLCWLTHCRGMSPEQAQELLLRVRPHTNPLICERAVVREFVQRYSDKTN